MDYERYNEFLQLQSRLSKMAQTSNSWLVAVSFFVAACVCDVMMERMKRRPIT